MSRVTQQELRDYVSMIVAMKPNLAVEPQYRELLTEILWIVMTKKDFEVTLDDLTSLLEVMA